MSTETDQTVLAQRLSAAMKDYDRTIGTFARSCVYQLPGMDLDDIKQELLIVLWRCVQNYDPDRGASFNTLFQGSARNHVIGMVRTANAAKRGKGSVVSLDPEAFSVAAERSRSDGSAEDWYLALAEYGPAFEREARLAG